MNSYVLHGSSVARPLSSMSFAGAPERRWKRSSFPNWRGRRGSSPPPNAIGLSPPKFWLASEEKRGTPPTKLRELAFDVLIALSAREIGATLIICNREDFAEIRKYKPFNVLYGKRLEKRAVLACWPCRAVLERAAINY